MTKAVNAEELLCPSGQQASAGARVFGVQVPTPTGETRVGYLPQAYPATEDILALAGEAAPAQVLRIAAPCDRCHHHDGHSCQLAQRVVAMLDPVVGSLPRCAIRPTCLWFRQEGREACVRCPQVMTIKSAPTQLDQAVAGLPVGDAEDLTELRARRAPVADAG